MFVCLCLCLCVCVRERGWVGKRLLLSVQLSGQLSADILFSQFQL